MAGRPKVKADLAILKNLTVGDTDYIFDRLADGEMLYQIAEGFRVGRAALYRWILADPSREARYKQCPEFSASTFAEQAVTIAHDESRATEEQAVQRDKLRIDTRRWIASRWDRNGYGEQRGAAVNISLGTLHIDALRAAAPLPEPPSRRNRVIDASAEESSED